MQITSVDIKEHIKKVETNSEWNGDAKLGIKVIISQVLILVKNYITHKRST